MCKYRYFCIKSHKNKDKKLLTFFKKKTCIHIYIFFNTLKTTYCASIDISTLVSTPLLLLPLPTPTLCMNSVVAR